jgi:D-alanine transaminase
MPAPLPVAHLNGSVLPAAELRVSVFDRGFLFADGVYEAIAVYEGRAFRLAEHLSRLARSLREMRILDPHDPQGWRALIEALVASNGGGSMTVYLQVTRGAELTRDHAFPSGAVPTVFGCCFAWPGPPEALVRNGVAVVTQPDERWGRCDIKSTNLTANVLARQMAVDAGASEAILVRDDRALECSSSSLMIVEGTTVITPPDGPQILAGTTRNLLRELAPGAELSWSAEPIPVARLRAADEIWIASTTREVLAVTRLDGAVVGNGRPGPMWQRMHAALRAHVTRFVAGVTGSAAAIIQYPVVLPLKIIGQAAPGLRERVLALVAAHATIETESVRERQSGGARYLSLTVNAKIESREALEALYAALRASDDVVWAL